MAGDMHTRRRSLGCILRHLWMDAQDARRQVGTQGLARLEERVRASELKHSAELRVCIEGGLSAAALWRGTTARARALELFSALQVWDTEHNNGVLIYLLLAERRIEILADRALARRVDAQTWDAITERLAEALRAGRFEEGLSHAVDEVTSLVLAHFGLDEQAHNPNELPDTVVVL